jgi:ubiquinone biosynthesis protein UbiJ
MVARAHDHDGSDGTCSDCIAAIEAILHFDIEDGEEEFDDGFGDLIDSMHNALAAIHRARRESLNGKHSEIANSQEAATELWRVLVAIHEVAARGRAMLDAQNGRD